MLGHLGLDSAHKTADITVEQELSRPYAYIAHRLVPSGIEIISIKDPAKPVLLWTSFVKNAELHKGAGSLGPTIIKTKGRYYFFNGFQFAQGIAEGLEAKVRLAFGALHAIEKRGQFDQPEPRVHEIEIEHLLACHRNLSFASL